ncbi:MAG TPA: hypothetical protein VEH77_02540, partial [Roseiarcus sp.]|nr:hypothetical protein [Roseiarcus sp.]
SSPALSTGCSKDVIAQPSRKADEKAVRADLHAVMNADTATKARSAARRFAARWAKLIPPPSPACVTISTSF